MEPEHEKSEAKERAGGAVNGRTAAIAVRIAKRRDELERTCHVGLALLTWRRFGEIEGGDLSVLMTLSLFLAMVPLILMIFSWASAVRPAINAANMAIRQYNLHGTEADVVRATFASANSARTSTTFFGVLGLLAAGFPASVAVQKTFCRAWRAPKLSLFHSYLRGGAWFAIYVVVFLGGEKVRWAVGRDALLAVIAVPIGLALLMLLWMATPHLLLGKNLGGWRGLMPTAIAGTAFTVIFWVASSLVMPSWLGSWAVPFGTIGVTLALITWVGFLMLGWVAVACFGAVYWERIAEPKVVLAVEGGTPPH